MPCYITYKAYATIEDKDYISFINAVKALGYTPVAMGNVTQLGDGVELAKTQGKYELRGGSRVTAKKMMEEHNIRKIEKEARKKGQKTKRQVDEKGLTQLVVIA
tara:strand:+ start:288 stop:599 length:312 start_codon:yes stop_codon:yes gene_type:complete